MHDAQNARWVTCALRRAPMSAEFQVEALAFLIEKKIVTYDRGTDTYRLLRRPSAQERRSLSKHLGRAQVAA